MFAAVPFIEFAFHRRLQGVGIEDFADEFGFVDMQSIAGGTSKTPGADFRRTRMIEAGGTPGGLEPIPCRRQPRSGLAGVDGGANGRGGDIDAILRRDLGKVEGVGRRGDENGRFVGEDRIESLARRHAAAGDRHGAQLARPLVSAPEADEGTKRECEENAVDAGDAGLPALSPPGPAPGCVEPAQALSSRTRRLVDAHILAAMAGEIRAVRGMVSLVGRQLLFGSEGKLGVLLPTLHSGGVTQSGCLQFAAVEGV